jgi:hypothetical protein
MPLIVTRCGYNKSIEFKSDERRTFVDGFCYESADRGRWRSRSKGRPFSVALANT